jgi:hypothetical protein
MNKKKMRRIIRTAERRFGADVVFRLLSMMWNGDETRAGYNPEWAGTHRGRVQCVAMLDHAIKRAEDRLAALIVKRSEAAKRAQAKAAAQTENA